MRRSFLLIIILITSATQTNLASPNLLAGTLYPLAFVSALTLLITILIVEGKRRLVKGININNRASSNVGISEDDTKDMEAL
jgi:hypothetical protein